MITRNVKLWLGKSESNVYLPVSQFDSMWEFVFTIYDGSTEWQIPAGAEIVLNGLKPDGNTFSFRGTVASNKVSVLGDVQMTAVAGNTKCELSVMSGGRVVGTANFTLVVEAAPKAPGDISSETTLPAYAEILEELAQLLAGGGGGGGGTITIDDSLSTSSTNPVQNRVITLRINDLVALINAIHGVPSGGTTNQVLKKSGNTDYAITWGDQSGTVTVDESMSDSSTNPVQNRAIKNAIDAVAEYAASNLSYFSGGTTGQVLTKASGSSLDFTWTTPSGGGSITISATGDPPNRMLVISDGVNTYSTPLLTNDKITTGLLPEATTSARGAMSASDKTKLDGIDMATKWTVGTNITGAGGGARAFGLIDPRDNQERKVPVLDPSNDLIYPILLPDATTSAKGAMSASDKTKLDGLTGIPAGGSAGQVLAKASGTDKDVTWITPSGGGGSVNDVTVAGTSVLSSGTAVIPSAESTTWGVVKVTYTTAASPSDVPSGSIHFGSNRGFDLPVLNPGRKLVNGYLNLDSSITSGGANPVTGGAIYTALNGKISAPSSPTTGQILVYNGTAWVAGSASTGAFYAVYGTTTNAEIEAAYQAGKAIFCIYDNELIIPLATRTDANEVTFVGVVSNVIISLGCCEDDWDNSSLALTPNGLGFFIKPSERTVSTSGDVTAQISNHEIVHFVGQLSSLTITFSSSIETGIYPYHFDFTTDDYPPTLTLPQSVQLPDGFVVEANKRYEVDILNNYASIQSWTVS